MGLKSWLLFYSWKENLIFFLYLFLCFFLDLYKNTYIIYLFYFIYLFHLKCKGDQLFHSCSMFLVISCNPSPEEVSG